MTTNPQPADKYDGVHLRHCYTGDWSDQNPDNCAYGEDDTCPACLVAQPADEALDELRNSLADGIFGHDGVSVGAPANIAKMLNTVMADVTAWHTQQLNARLGEAIGGISAHAYPFTDNEAAKSYNAGLERAIRIIKSKMEGTKDE